MKGWLRKTKEEQNIFTLQEYLNINDDAIIIFHVSLRK